MKLIGFLVVVALIARASSQKLNKCNVAASCEYSDGSTRYQIRKLPTQKEVKDMETTTTVVTSGTAPSGLEGWVIGTNYYYLYMPDDVSYGNAKLLCQAKGGRLVGQSFSDPAAFASFKKILRTYNINGVWVDATDEVSEGDWKWGDGSTLSSTSETWKVDQPDNRGNNQDCAWMEGWKDSDKFGLLDDAECDSAKFKFMCEKPMA